MPVFEYRATNSDGQTVRGTLLSGTLAQAAEELARSGLQVHHLQAATGFDDPALQMEPPPGRPERPSPPPTEARPAVMTDLVGPLFNRVGLAPLQFFFRQLSTMLKAGVPMVQTLDTLAGQTGDPRLKAVVRELHGHALEGRPISAGLQRYPEMFSPLILSLVRVGERGGMMDVTCRQIADYLEREIELRNLVRRVTIYPKLVIGASIVIILGANAIIALFGRQGGLSSPLTTWSTWVCLGPVLIGLFLFYRVGMQNPRVRHNYEQAILALPYFGTTVRQLAMARFGRAFGALYAGGVAVPEAMRLAADACGNEYMRSKLHPLAYRLEEGAGLAETFRSADVFSPIVLDMVHTGETTGNVDAMLGKMADFYEDESKVRTTQAAYALGVLALLLVGGYVAYVVVTFYQGYIGGIFQSVDSMTQ